MPALPIDAVLPEVIAALAKEGSVVVRAAPGAGKTTRIPPAILDAGLAGPRKILVLQPRRLAARAAAAYVARERGNPLGTEVGYRVRFDRRAGPQTRIEFITEGIFLRLLQDDPFLESVAAVIFDEFHERSLQSDLGLAMALRVRNTVRPELKLAVMSATLEPGPITQFLGGCPAVESEGRRYPVEIHYREGASVVDGVASMLAGTTGDLLVFLPGVHEIRQAARQLERLSGDHNLAVLPLYGDLPAEKQDEVLRPLPQRKVVLATNVAETSLTIEGITGVVDTGLARTLIFDAHTAMDRLQVHRISQAATEQRAGRAGRTQPGVCLRLWPERAQRARPAYEEPEIRRLDLAGPLLQLAAWGETNPESFPWFEPPSADAVQQGQQLLERLGALAKGKVTRLGQQMARLPLHPRLARILIEGRRLGQPAAVALAAALLSERDPFLRPGPESAATNGPPPPSNSDIFDRVFALERFEESGALATPLGSLNRGAARQVLRARDQLLRELEALSHSRHVQRNTDDSHAVVTDPPVADPEIAIGRALFTAFPDRLVRRSNPGSRFGRMVGGRGVRQAAASAVIEAPLFLAIDVDAGTAEALVRKAVAVAREWLPSQRLITRVEVEFDPSQQKVFARRRVFWEDLLLDESPAALPPGEEVARILAAAAADALERVFPWDEPGAADYVQRRRCLAGWMPELGLPPLDDDGLRAALPQVALGCRSFEELRRAAWQDVLDRQLTPLQRESLRREAPARIEVPSGNQIRLEYTPGKPPVLAVRIQELFGMKTTPRVAAGRVAVVLHLLAPNFRPQQVTDDLESFWRNAYHQVRKDLRRRYPKHDWPEDPLQAVARRRPKKNS